MGTVSHLYYTPIYHQYTQCPTSTIHQYTTNIHSVPPLLYTNIPQIYTVSHLYYTPIYHQYTQCPTSTIHQYTTNTPIHQYTTNNPIYYQYTNIPPIYTV